MKKPREVGYKELEIDFPGFGDSGVLSYDMPPKYGQMSLNELAILARIIESVKPTNIFEFGRCDGATSCQLALSAPKAQVITLDLPEAMGIYATSNSCNAIERWTKFGVVNRIVELLIDSRHLNVKDYLDSFDVVLIDAGHELDEIKMDTENAYKMLKSGGLVVWHDYQKRSFPAVTSFLAANSVELGIRWVNSREEYLETSLCYAFKE
jgi:predicted O-methyltransferase YrrM